jgi:hypothetical protein
MTETDEYDQWLDHYDRLSNIAGNYTKEPQNSIEIFHVFINVNDYIEKIESEHFVFQHTVDSDKRIISREQVIQIIERGKRKQKRTLLDNGEKTRYKLLDILVYHVNLETDQIQSYAKIDSNDSAMIGDVASGFLKILNMPDEIVIEPSIFIFHEVNAVYFIFKESERNSGHIHNSTLKSILKKNGTVSAKKNVDNKVRFTKRVVLNHREKNWKHGENRKTKRCIVP